MDFELYLWDLACNNCSPFHLTRHLKLTLKRFFDLFRLFLIFITIKYLYCYYCNNNNYK